MITAPASSPFPEALIQRIRRKVKDLNESTCWNYQGSRNEKGYGRIWFGGRQFYVHRVMCAHALGRELTATEIVCHQCDNPRCCNPKHLVAADLITNVREMHDRGRAAKPRVKVRLTEDQVACIRLSLTQNHSVRSLAVRFQCGESTIRHIKMNRTWGGGIVAR